MRESPRLRILLTSLGLVVLAGVVSLGLIILLVLRSSAFHERLVGWAQKALPAQAGLQVQFSRTGFSLMPPALTVDEMVLRVVEDPNLLGVPVGTTLRVGQVRLTWLLRHLWARRFILDQVKLTQGELIWGTTPLAARRNDPPAAKATPRILRWENLLGVRINEIRLEDFQVQGPERWAAHVDQLALSRSWSLGRDQRRVVSYTLEGGIRKIAGLDLPVNLGHRAPPQFDVQGKIQASAEGIAIPQFIVRTQGLSADSTGEFVGDVLENLRGVNAPRVVHGRVQVQADLQAITGGPVAGLPIVHTASAGRVQGELRAQSRWNGEGLEGLKSLWTQLRAELEVEANALQIQDWRADRVRLQGSWATQKVGGELSVKRLEVRGANEPRRGLRIPGSGGEINVEPFTTHWGGGSPLEVSVGVKQAHIHWLLGPAFRSVFPLQFRTTGRVSVRAENLFGTDSKPWRMRADLDHLELRDLVLDNQKFGRVRPVSRLFQIPVLSLQGGVELNAQCARPVDLELRLPRSRLPISGDLNFKRGLHLRTEGSVNLEDLGPLAGAPISGVGRLAVNVHGPLDHYFVDLDPDLEQASYVRLNLGNLRGRIRWDDRANALRLIFLELSRNHTHYTAKGVVDFGPKESVSVHVEVPHSGEMADLLEVGAPLLADIPKFPRKLVGEVEGQIDLSGMPTPALLRADTILHGRNWKLEGESFKSVEIKANYLGGRTVVEDLSLIKNTGTVQGRISFGGGPSTVNEWELGLENFTLGDLNSVRRLSVPVRGHLYLKTEGRGRSGSWDSRTEFRMENLAVHGIKYAASGFDLQTSKGKMQFQGHLLGEQAVLHGELGGTGTQKREYLEAKLVGLDFAPLLFLLNSSLIDDREIQTALSGNLRLDFPQGFNQANGKLQIDEFLLAKSGYRLALAHPLRGQIQHGSFDWQDIQFRNVRSASTPGRELTTHLDLHGEHGSLGGRLYGSLNLGFLEVLHASVLQAFGPMQLDLQVGGTLQAPTLAGRVELSDGALRLRALESPLENLKGEIQYAKGIAVFRNFRADLGGGRLYAEGRAGAGVQGDEKDALGLDLNTRFKGTQLRIAPFQFVKTSGDVRVHGNKAPYVVDGALDIDSALSKEKMLNTKKTAASLRALQYGPPPSAETDVQSSAFKLNLQLKSAGGILIQNDLFKNLEARCELTVVNTPEAPRLLGKVDAISGTMLFKDHLFTVQSASVNFNNPIVLNPMIDLVAVTEVDRIRVQIYVTGKTDQLRFELTSNPAMPDNEILSLLTLGYTAQNARLYSASSLSTLQQGEAASLVLHSLDFNREIEEQTGFQLQLDEAINPQQAVSAFTPQANMAASPQITIRRRLGNRLSLSAGSTVGAGTNMANQLNLDFSINPGLSIQGVFNNYGTSGASETTPSSTSTGVDLKFQKRFR